jgi:very-short-patch-repair endonuclease
VTNRENKGCLTALLQWLGLAPKPKPKPSFPYHLRDDFLSPAEISFYHVLQNVIGDGAIICPKVSLGDLFYAKTGDYGKNRSWMNRIDRKHVDFLVCTAKTMRPIFGVELDDSSHRREQRMERDRFVNRVFSAAGLPLARVKAQAQYNTDELKAYLRQTIAQAEEQRATSAAPEETEHAANDATPTPPPCPKCGASMVLREVKRDGPRKGEKFWGCPNFPQCRGTRDFDETVGGS